ncbi:hypothetical protein SELMODRAFT_179923 [Selaginella moellendorffii]|uniref:Histidine-containing phosphotransfer protein n=1 Tax=Selaginella moellendorffii TaxID=88036 RepID=D8SI72_SELML|nr:histidine-containing phosphotransfer protein 1 [Selaginella moellendorffii]XP_002983113.1 histidine-containing phosphotransfer protein 1 isoform X2 [Selaginella moellendorffii]XP_024526018.1 histidine-containing phosphotransfer protein 1 [Selaginella moellendorffii]EFJ15922.1 hypothetical protein SELMODRAFT_179923 [Selaginella moellendorffii]|eukprot:XP_002965866.2 histidine-containing phosphotransfer protein 1 [Selaginella moellendorffii]
MAAAPLEQKYVELTEDMFKEGFLDDQFVQLQQLQDPSNPGFVAEVVTLFFEDSEKIIDSITETLETDPLDFKVLDAHVHQFKGSSSSIGAQRVKNVCISFRQCCDASNKEGCVNCLQQVKREYQLVKARLETLLQLEEQIVAAGGIVPQFE